MITQEEKNQMLDTAINSPNMPQSVMREMLEDLNFVGVNAYFTREHISAILRAILKAEFAVGGESFALGNGIYAYVKTTNRGMIIERSIIKHEQRRRRK